LVAAGIGIVSCIIPALKTMQGTKSEEINVSEQSTTSLASISVALTEEKENPSDDAAFLESSRIRSLNTSLDCWTATCNIFPACIPGRSIM
jgi:uncharacterized membrane protein required for colicin V production